MDRYHSSAPISTPSDGRSRVLIRGYAAHPAGVLATLVRLSASYAGLGSKLSDQGSIPCRGSIQQVRSSEAEQVALNHSAGISTKRGSVLDAEGVPRG